MTGDEPHRIESKYTDKRIHILMARLPAYFKIIGTKRTNEGLRLIVRLKWWGYPLLLVKKMMGKK